jgi:hypothetical protein
MKVCKLCGELKHLTDFHNNKGMKDGKLNCCKSCTNQLKSEDHRKHKEERKQKFKDWQTENPEKYYRMMRNSKLKVYGLTIEDYEALLEEQKGVCKICEKPETKGTGRDKGTLAVDHCHRTGKVRGLLCSSCNRGLGFFGDDLLLLNKAVDYLNENSTGC